jgi:hypothetical protein
MCIQCLGHFSPFPLPPPSPPPPLRYHGPCILNLLVKFVSSRLESITTDAPDGDGNNLLSRSP